MSITVNPAVFEMFLEAAFSSAKLNVYSLPTVNNFIIYGGSRPLTVTSTAGATALTGVVGIAPGSFSPIANNTAILSTPLAFTPTAAAEAVFVRFYTGATPVMDISVSATPGVGVAALESTTCAIGVENNLTDLRFVMGNNTNLQLSSSIASFFLERLTNPSSPATYDSEKLAAASTLNPVSLNYDRPITVTAFKGVMPNGDVPVVADGSTIIQLWDVTVVPDDLFSVSGNIISLAEPLTAVAYASHTPDFVTITKGGFAGSFDNFPDCAIYAKVGDAVVFSPSTFTNTNDATLITLSLAFGGELPPA